MKDGDARAALVTGAAGGLGLAVATLLMRDGANVSILDIDAERLSKSAESLPRKAHVIVADVGDTSECDRAVKQSIERWGRLDILVNCASILRRVEFDELDAEVFERIININMRSVFWLCRAASNEMKVRQWGRIVNVTSVGVHTGGFSITSAVYEATKGAVGNFTRTLARHLAHEGILVNAVAPGAMRTRMILDETPAEVLDRFAAGILLGRIADASEVAECVAFLASDRNTYSTGNTFDVNGGLVMP